MGRRVELHNILVKTLGSRNVYFQPGSTVKLEYPCIIYSYAGPRDTPADNKTYHRNQRYTLIYVTRDPDDPLIDKLCDLQYCSFDRPYISDNLYHYSYSIYY